MCDTIVSASIGLVGVFVGAVATGAMRILENCLQQREVEKRDKPRKELLRSMLNHPEHQWRKLGTLMHVIGAEEDTTKRLLLELGARASEDGKQLWGLISKNPLPNKE